MIFYMGFRRTSLMDFSCIRGARNCGQKKDEPQMEVESRPGLTLGC